jgi:ActR/RegA family two-component response regulator
MSDAVDIPVRTLLIVEDEYLLAADLAWSFERLGIEVIGPASSVDEALSLVKEHGPRLEGAVLDINLRSERVYRVADALAEIHVPFIFTTGYDATTIPDPYDRVARCEKPVDTSQLLRWFSRLAPKTAGGRKRGDGGDRESF